MYGSSLEDAELVRRALELSGLEAGQLSGVEIQVVRFIVDLSQHLPKETCARFVLREIPVYLASSRAA